MTTESRIIQVSRGYHSIIRESDNEKGTVHGDARNHVKHELEYPAWRSKDYTLENMMAMFGNRNSGLEHFHIPDQQQNMLH